MDSHRTYGLPREVRDLAHKWGFVCSICNRLIYDGDLVCSVSAHGDVSNVHATCAQFGPCCSLDTRTDEERHRTYNDG